MRDGMEADAMFSTGRPADSLGCLWASLSGKSELGLGIDPRHLINHPMPIIGTPSTRTTTED
jgi:hypothetical protein